MGLISWIIVGAIAGWIASILTNTNTGLFKDIIIGMVGSLVGGFVVNLFSSENADFTTAFTHFSFTSLVVSIIGAVLVLSILKFIRKENA